MKVKSWEKLNFDDFQKQVYSYTKHILRQLEEYVLPEYIKVRNEVTNGMVMTDGKIRIVSSASRQFEDEKTAERLNGQQAFDLILTAMLYLG